MHIIGPTYVLCKYTDEHSTQICSKCTHQILNEPLYGTLQSTIFLRQQKNYVDILWNHLVAQIQKLTIIIEMEKNMTLHVNSANKTSL